MVHLDGRSLTLEQLAGIADGGERVAVSDEAMTRVAAARAVVDRVAEGDAPVYGINTGFGIVRRGEDPPRVPRAAAAEPAAQPRGRRRRAAARPHRASDDGAARQRPRPGVLGHPPRHARRPGPAAQPRRAPRWSRAAARWARAATSRRSRTWPWCSSARAAPGSTGASVPGAEALRASGLSPVSLEAKEGLALINGTQASTAVLGLALLGAERLARAADIAAALSTDALRGSSRPFDPRIHAERPLRRPGGIGRHHLRPARRAAAINASHADCGRVQDAYSERCAAQVHGSAREALRFVRRNRDRRGQLGDRQPDGVRRRRARSCRAATSTARRWRWPPTCWRSRSPSSPRSASAAPSGSSTPRSASCRRS